MHPGMNQHSLTLASKDSPTAQDRNVGPDVLRTPTLKRCAFKWLAAAVKGVQKVAFLGNNLYPRAVQPSRSRDDRFLQNDNKRNT
jgi:hypothetical protein